MVLIMMIFRISLRLHLQFLLFHISGTLSDTYPVSGFMKTIEKLTREGYSLKLRFVGSVSSAQRDLIISKAGTAAVEFIAYVNHSEAVRLYDGSLPPAAYNT